MSDPLIPLDTRGRAVIVKDPDAVLDYSWDWTDWLASVPPDTIASVTVIGTDVTIDSFAHDGLVVTAWISGGTLFKTATAVCRITTTQGRVDDRTIYLKIRER